MADTEVTNGPQDFEFSSAVKSEPAKSPLSMALLFYIVTICAIVSVCLRTLIGNEAVTPEVLGRLVLGGMVMGFLSGAGMGIFYLKTRYSVLLGSAIGFSVGAVAGVLAMVGSEHFFELNVLAFVGCWLLLLMMLLAARFSET